jgi:hypothetical protein
MIASTRPVPTPHAAPARVSRPRARLTVLRGVAALLAVLCGIAVLLPTTPASAAPIVVNLRVEGATKTLYEGPVSTEAISAPPGIETPSSKGSHPCDVKDNGENGGYGAPGATPTDALYDAALAQHLALDAKWELNDFKIEQIGEDIANSANNGEYWGYSVDYTTAEVGGCQVRLAPGSEVLWAYNFFGLPHLLSLSGPASVNVGTPFTVHVTDGQTGQPIEGAQIGQFAGGVTTTSGSSPTTDKNGNATVMIAQTGTESFKATQPESVRSNGLTICAHNGNDGNCGTTSISDGSPEFIHGPLPTPLPAVAHAGSVRNGRHYPRRAAPRVLSGSVEVPAGDTLREVRLSLQRSNHGRCFALDGARAAFVHAKCHAQRFFKVAATSSFSYLLPARLPAGRYVYAVEAVNNTGLVTAPTPGVSRVVFYVK